jgi:hypothetical protein
MIKSGDLLVSWVSYFNYDMIIILINVHHFHTIDNSCGKLCEKILAY